jgi:hypothetical protein
VQVNTDGRRNDYMPKVKSIKCIDSEDVYNMEVARHHNFAVNGGLIVHNCDALRGFCIMRQSPTLPSNGNTGRNKQNSFDFDEPEQTMELHDSYINMSVR